MAGSEPLSASPPVTPYSSEFPSPATPLPPPLPPSPGPQPIYIQPGTYNPPYYYSYSGLAPFRPQFGVGLLGTGFWAVSELLNYWQGGVGLDLLVRVHPRLTLEVLSEYQYSNTPNPSSRYYDRTDIPILGGIRINLGSVYWSVSPYLAGALGADYARAIVPTASETAWFAEIQGGAGLEIRAGRHLAINIDARVYGRMRPNTNNAIYITDLTGNEVQILGNQTGLLMNAGIAVYF
jgi:hypothetical protein